MGKDKELRWKQQIVIPVTLPIINDWLKLEIWDENEGLVKDTIIGSIPLQISKIANGDFAKP